MATQNRKRPVLDDTPPPKKKLKLELSPMPTKFNVDEEFKANARVVFGAIVEHFKNQKEFICTKKVLGLVAS